jgi:hypothetical protein
MKEEKEMSRLKNQIVRMRGGWNIHLSVDDDNHIGVYVSNEDDSEIVAQDADIAGPNEWAERFTSTGIEKEYREEQK